MSLGRRVADTGHFISLLLLNITPIVNHQYMTMTA